jgi:DNA-binding NarL/FixJ family response regulator
LGPVRILVADDFEPWRRWIVSMIEEQPGLEVIHEAFDGLEVVQACRELRPDLVLLDVGLPTLSGLEAAQQIREVSPDSKIVFVSAMATQDIVREALRIGAAGYVAKVDAGRDLLRAVRAAAADQEFLSFSVLRKPEPDLSRE